ncbi:hypothetical protein ES703_41469 [subsurface metagenome]
MQTLRQISKRKGKEIEPKQAAVEEVITIRDELVETMNKVYATL